MNSARENRARAAHCLKALRRYGTDSSPYTCLGDFLADAMHWCRLEGHDFQHLLDRASQHYAAEVFDEGTPAAIFNPESPTHQKKETL
jgi:hypothetical protein